MDATDTRRLTGRLRKFIRVRRFEHFMDEDDLIQIGLVAAVEAEERFEKGKRVPLWVWRAIRAEGAIKDAVRGESQLRTRAENRVKVVYPDGMTEDARDRLCPPALSAEDEYFTVVFPRERFDEFMDYLRDERPQLAYVAIRKFLHDAPHRDIAAEVGVVESRVSQMIREVQDHAVWWQAHN